MGLEEQREERDVLESIFPDEITGEVFPFLTAHPRPNTDFLSRYLRHRVSNIHSVGCHPAWRRGH